MKFTEKISNNLNELLTKNYDAEAGYKLAEENVKDNTLKEYFGRKAKERYDFGHQIKNEIKVYGESPDKGTSVAGDAHRLWMNVKSTISKNSEEAILEETIRGEKKCDRRVQCYSRKSKSPTNNGSHFKHTTRPNQRHIRRSKSL